MRYLKKQKVYILVFEFSDMNCDKCGIDAPVRYRDVDGFAYYLCVTCMDQWDAVLDSTPGFGERDQSVA